MLKYILCLGLALGVFSCKSYETSHNAVPGKANPIVLDHSLTIPKLDRTRQIRIYLPPGYYESDLSYPVLYMQDGQNLFDDATAYAGEWGVDESLNALAVNAGLKMIVVGIDNGQEKRINELSPWENKKYGKAEGEQYVEFMVHQLKPFIDSNFRTLPDRKHTSLMGSSLGGLISHYALFQYPDVFGKAAIFSPSYWYADEVYGFTQNHPLPRNTKIFMLIGEKEEGMVDPAKKMYQLILDGGQKNKNLKLVSDPEGEHNERFWRKQFTPAMEWLYLGKK
ncbi:alpha/beta hydrolase-fold protein [Flavobacteriaceae bacterium KMM 6897]|nr:alpha/beta hydrolase-fold protein [Flavobacteriaceae bacterium KMM 6897]